MRILIDGLNFEMPRGTGIKTYARSVVAALSDAGQEVDVLSQQAVRRVRGISPRAAYLAASLSDRDATRAGLRSRAADAVLQRGGLHKSRIAMDESTRRHAADGLMNADWMRVSGVQLAPFLFTRAFAKAGLGLGGVRLPTRMGADVLFLTSPLPLSMPAGRTVLTVHDLIPLTHPWLVANWSTVGKAIGRSIDYAIGKADKILCVSDHTRRELLERYRIPEHKLHVVYQPCRASQIPGGEARRAARAILQGHGVPEGEYVLFVGAIEPKKNLLNLLRAMRADPSLASLVVVGRFGWMARREAQLIRELRGRVHHLGFLSDPELECVRAGASAFVFPSFVEGFGLPVQEAMAAGVPCVISDIPVFHELFDGHATFVDPFSPEDIGSGIRQALRASDTDRDELRAFVQDRFSFERFADGLMDVIGART